MVEFLFAAAQLALLQAVLAELAKAVVRRGGWHALECLRSSGAVAAAWFVLQLAVGGLLLWPIRAVQQTQSLWSALTLALAAGLLVIGLQRVWPNWAQWQRDWRQGWPALDSSGAAFRFWSSALAGGVLLALAAPAVLQAAGWAFWAADFRLWLCAYVVLAALWHGVASALPLPRLAETPASAPTTGRATPVLALDPDLRLLQAVHDGQVDIALDALEQGANPHQLPAGGAKDQRSLMMIAATLGDLRLLRGLIAHGVDVNAFHGGLNALLSATRDSWHGRPEAVTMLLANGARTEVVDRDGNTPLHHAMRSTDAAVAALLLDAGADIEAVNRDGFTPLALACQAANWRVARYMLERKAKTDPAGAQPVIIAAAGAEDDEIGIRLLHKHKAKIDARGSGGRTALMVAAEAGLVEVVAVLLELGAQINLQDDAGLSAHMLAAKAGEVDVLKRLQQSPRLNAQATDQDGKTALDHALANGRWSAVACIDPDYALPEHLAREPEREHRVTGSQQLFHVLSDADFAAAADLLQAGLAPGGPELAELYFLFCQQDRRDVLAWLRRQGAHLFSRDAHGRDVYRRLLQGAQNPSALLSHCLAAGETVSGNGTLAAYLDCCLHNDFGRRADEQFALQLLAQGADAFAAAEGGMAPPLVTAVRLGWQRLCDALLALGADANAPDAAGLTALHFAAQSGNTGLLKTLLAAGADAERRAGDGQTPLGSALINAHAEAARWLSWPRWPLPGRRLHGGDLSAAAAAGDHDAVARLLALGVPVDGVDAKGSTALIHACGQGRLDTVALLLANGADAGKPARGGVTPLWAALSQMHGEVLRALLAHGIEVNQAVAGFPPLNLACVGGDPEPVALLLEHGADIGAVDGQGQNALHACCGYLASERARLESVVLVDSLIRAGAAVDAVDKYGQTPMHLLCGAGLQKGQTLKEDLALSALDRLLQASPAVDAPDARGFTPLHHAAARGYGRLVGRLLAAGADRSRRDNLGRSAYDFAVMGGFSETANLLQDRPERVDIASLLVKKDQG